MSSKPRSTKIAPADLPQRPGEWRLTVRKLSVWVKTEEGRPARPYLMLLANLGREQILEYSLNYEAPTLDEILELLWKAMLHPARELRQAPQRPEEIICDQEALAEQLIQPMGEIGVKVGFQVEDPLMNSLVQLIEDDFGKESEGQGLMSVQGTTPEQIGDLFEAAAEAYRQESWIYLSSEQPVKFSIPDLNKEGFILIMGNSAVEYGLLLFDTWSEVERAFLNSGDPHPTPPENGWVGLSYVSAELMAIEDIESIEKYGWTVEDQDAYPLPMVMFEDRVESPDLDTLLTFTALLRALPLFVQALEPDFKGDYLPLVTQTSVLAASKPRLVTLEYPAGILRRESFPASIALDDLVGEDEFEDSEDELDQIEMIESIEFAMDTALAEGEEDQTESLIDWQTSSIAANNPALIEAMGLVYEAWNLSNPIEIVELARRALEISPDCAEAYLLLGENLAVNIGQVYKYYQKAVAAAERGIGLDYITEHSGHLWQEVTARPYLRSLAELSRVLWELNRRSEALELCLKLVKLDEDDHVWARIGALHLFLELDNWDGAYQLLVSIDDSQSSWKYSRALVTFHREGDTVDARYSLAEAFSANPHVPEYLTGRKRLPPEIPESIHAGDRQEAIAYAADFIQLWRRLPGALDWLRKETRRKTEPSRQTVSRTKTRPPHRR